MNASIRFLADEDLHGAIIDGLRAREPAIDILDVKDSGLRKTRDSDLLELAAIEHRIVLSHDRGTMSRHYRDRLLAGHPTAGLILISQRAQLGDVIEYLILVWAAMERHEWAGRIVFL